MTYGNGLTGSVTYNTRLQPTEMRSYDPAPCTPVPSCQDKLKLTYSFIDVNGKNNGNVMSWSATAAQTFNRTYSYDELNRLKTMSAPGETCLGLSWTYDIWANRTNQNGAGGPCNEHHPTINALNRIAELSYDLAGNVTANGSTTYQYDAENRMVSINNGCPSTTCYVYDAAGRRVRKIASGTTPDESSPTSTRRI